MQCVDRKLFLILICFIFTGCGTTHILTDQPLNADIYINGINRGQNNVEIERMGIPKRIEISAKYDGRTIGQVSERRRFDWATFLVGYFTYGIGFLTAWRFPEQIIIPTKADITPEGFSSPWDHPENNFWMQPVRKSDN